MNIYEIESAVEWTNWFNFMVLCAQKRATAFVELGVYKGGFAGPFIDRARRVEHFSYIGFDNNPDEVDRRIVQAASETPRAHLLFMDFNKADAAAYVESVRAKSVYPRNPVLFFVDGFHKRDEFRTWFERARVGDHIAVHDFDPTNSLTPRDIMRQDAIDPYLAARRVELYYPAEWMRLDGTLSVVKTAD